MPVMRTYECPDCGGRFEFLHMQRDEPPPTHCKLCRADMGVVTHEMAAPHIAKSIGKVADNVYRQMENASAARAEMAAEAAGCDVSEMSALKITDLKDNARAGETSNVVARNEVSDFMQRTGGATGVISAEQGLEYARSTTTGPYAGVGGSMIDPMKSTHWSNAAKVTAAGNVGVARGG